jgi:hypothetical protein
MRRILDERLGDGPNHERAEAIRKTAGLLADYPDWPEWLASVRGAPAEERLSSLGLYQGPLNRLFDSTILIAHLRGDEQATALLEEGEPFASVVSRAEIEGRRALR